MTLMHFRFKTLVILLVPVILLQAKLGECDADFHRNTIGVTFSAYVRSNLSSPITNDHKAYTFDDIKTMVKVISGRFSKIITFSVGAGAENRAYEQGHMYSIGAYSQVFSAEAAAEVNREMTGKSTTPIEMYIGIQLYSNKKQREMEVELALESAQKANEIFPHTVKGFVINGPYLDTDLKNITFAADFMEKHSSSGIKMGTVQSCKGLGQQAMSSPSESPDLLQAKIELVKKSNFIICRDDFEEESKTLNASNSVFDNVAKKFLQYRDNFQSLSSQSIEVMGWTASKDLDLNQMYTYWKQADKWAAAENFTLWMSEAFDNPWKVGEKAHLGWWKLTSDSKSNSTEGYVEKMDKGRGARQGSQPPNPAAKPEVLKPNVDNGKKKSSKGGAGRECARGTYLGVFVVIALKMFI